MLSRKMAPAAVAAMFIAGCGGGGGGSYEVGPLWLSTDLKLADVDGDGRLDVVSLSYLAPAYPAASEGWVNVWRQTAPGVFSAPQAYRAGYSPWALATSDVDGDGAVDLVIADVGGSRSGGANAIWLLRQDAAAPGTFAPAQRLLDLPAQAYAVAVGDLNGDGAPDVVVPRSSSEGGGVTVLPQDPGHRGSFLPAVAVSLPGLWTSNLALGDVDGDGRKDLVARVGLSSYQGSSSTALGVRHGQTDGSLGPWTELPSPGQGLNSELLTIVDANKDGRADILEVLKRCCEGVVPQAVALLQAADGSFSRASTSLAALDGTAGQVFADLDGDGRSDVALVGSYPLGASPLRPPDIEARVNILRQGDGGAFALTQSTVLPFGEKIAAGDLDGDGLNDLVVFDYKADRAAVQLLLQSRASPGVFVPGAVLN